MAKTVVPAVPPAMPRCGRREKPHFLLSSMDFCGTGAGRRTAGNIEPATRVSWSEALLRNDDDMEFPMATSRLVGLAVLLSAAIATPVLAAGFDPATKPWPAPVGHRQPRVADIPTSASPSWQTLDQEDVNVDRKIRNICRGC
jgi:hypothetical protein